MSIYLAGAANQHSTDYPCFPATLFTARNVNNTFEKRRAGRKRQNESAEIAKRDCKTAMPNEYKEYCLEKMLVLSFWHSRFGARI